jgi:cell division protein FtsB
MRHSKALTAAGTVRANTIGVRQVVILIALAAGLLWVGVAFAQEAYVGHRLAQQVSDLKKQNADIAGQNAGYKKDVQALQSGTADEEEARLNGYARPNEKIYVVTAAPSPTPPAHH